MQTHASADAGAAVGGKYMMFRLAEERYGVDILRVREIVRPLPITRVPRTRPSVLGVVNLRGKVVPVIDLRLQFGMPAHDTTDQTVIIVLQCKLAGKNLTMGAVVDEVLEVVTISDQDTSAPPDLGTGALDMAFLLGVGRVDEQIVFLLDIARVLSSEDARAVADVSPGQP